MRVLPTSILLLALVIGLGPRRAPASSGPDIVICDLDSMMTWGSVDGVTAYSIGNTKGNAGDQDLGWTYNTDQHPVTFQNIYRFKDGRVEQIGMSWGFHGICALQLEDCLPCEGLGGCLTVLLPGCSSPNTASMSGYQPQLGPHWQINPLTGEFDFPFASADAQVDSLIRQRLQVANEDLDPDLNPGAVYFAEAVMVHPDDAAQLNQLNNASYRRINIGPAPGYTASVAGPTVVGQPVIHAWEDMDPGVQHSVVQIPDEGRLLLYYKATSNGNGTWHYEYALHNVDSDRSAGSFSIPVPSGVRLTNIGFHDVDYHSGDGIGGVDFDSTDWVFSADENTVTFSTATYEDNPNGNALRFGTTYNFRFDADGAPVPVDASIGLFKPAAPEAVAVATVGPELVCAADLDGNETVDVTDLLQLLAAWGACAGCAADIDGDGVVGVTDLLVLLAEWGLCP